MSTEYYSVTGNPAQGAAATTPQFRSEFALVMAGFAKLPVMAGNGSLPIFVNAGATALEAVSASTARANLGLGSMATQSATSPAITTSITTPSTTFSLINATATTVNAFGGASVALNIGHASGTNTVLGATTFSQAGTFSGTLAAGITTITDTTGTGLISRYDVTHRSFFNNNGTNGYCGTLDNQPFVLRTNNTDAITISTAQAVTLANTLGVTGLSTLPRLKSDSAQYVNIPTATAITILTADGNDGMYIVHMGYTGGSAYAYALVGNINGNIGILVQASFGGIGGTFSVSGSNLQFTHTLGVNATWNRKNIYLSG